MIWRCEQTNNPVETDTRMVGAPPCSCRGCRGAELQAENKRIREALKPFAEIADEIECSASEAGYSPSDIVGPARWEDCERARAALSQEDEA